MMNGYPPTTAPAREFYTREEFAELMRYSLRTVDEIIRQNRADVHRYGRNVRIPVEWVRKFKLEHILRAGNGSLGFAPEEVDQVRELLAPVVADLLRERMT